MAKIHADKACFLDVLGEHKNVFIVPKYQRAYSWEKENWREFFDDLLEVALGRTNEHFLGPIITCPSEDPDYDHLVKNGHAVREIVDGQQRFVTMLILLRVIFDIQCYEGNEKIAERIIYEKFFKEDEKEPYKILLSEENRAYFERSIQRKKVDRYKPKLRSEKIIFNAYDYFKERLIDSAEKNNGKNLSDFTDDFLKKIESNLVVVNIDVESDVKAYAIFETLNSRGKDLQAYELLKNFIFSVVDKGNNKVVLNSVRKTWEEMVADLKEFDIDPTEFVRHWWISKKEPVRSKDLYRRIKDFLMEAKGKDVEDFVNELAQEAETYRIFSSEKDGKRTDFYPEKIGKILQQINQLNIIQCRPLILSLLVSGAPEKKLENLLFKILSISLRRGLVGKNPNELERVYSKYAPAARSKNFELDKILEDLTDQNVDDQEVRDNLEKYDIDKKFAKFVLLRLEDEETPGAEKAIKTIKKVEIEHILPQNPEYLKDWGIDSPAHKELLQKIGNLTIIGPELNKKALNKKFTEKKKEYKKSAINITRIIGEQFTKWGKEQINKRTSDIADFIINRW